MTALLFLFHLAYVYVWAPLYYSLRLLVCGPDRSDGTSQWCRASIRWLRLRLWDRSESRSPAQDGGATVLLFNHRSWADFFVDNLVAGGGCAFVANPNVWWLVMFLAPVLYVYDMLIPLYGVKGRRRPHRETVQHFCDILEAYRLRHPTTPIGVYPEGRRHAGGESLPLKMAVVDWCFGRGESVQIYITAHKEDALNEFSWTSRAGADLYVARSAVLDPRAHASSSAEDGGLQSWRDAVGGAWREAWHRAYALPDPGECWRPLLLDSVPVPANHVELEGRRARWRKLLGAACMIGAVFSYVA